MNTHKCQGTSAAQLEKSHTILYGFFKALDLHCVYMCYLSPTELEVLKKNQRTTRIKSPKKEEVQEEMIMFSRLNPALTLKTDRYINCCEGCNDVMKFYTQKAKGTDFPHSCEQ